MMLRRSKQAFTMIEMLVVVALIGVIATFVIPRVARYLGRSEQAKIQLKFATIKEALTDFRISLGAYPTSREGLRALVENPRPNDDRYKREWHQFLKESEIVDATGNPFMYNCPPEKYKGEYSQFEIFEDKEDGVKDGI